MENPESLTTAAVIPPTLSRVEFRYSTRPMTPVRLERHDFLLGVDATCRSQRTTLNKMEAGMPRHYSQ